MFLFPNIEKVGRENGKHDMEEFKTLSLRNLFLCHESGKFFFKLSKSVDENNSFGHKKRFFHWKVLAFSEL